MDQIELLRRFVNVVERLGIDYFITGSQASTVYGEARYTHDIDVVVEMPAQKLKAFCASFPPPEFYVDETAAMQAMETAGQFNIIQPGTGLKIDVMTLPDSGYDNGRLARRRRIDVGEGVSAFFSAPEDVILMKMRFYREGHSEKHLRDIASMLKVSGALIDRAYLDHWSLRLGVADIWHAIVAKVDHPRAGPS